MPSLILVYYSLISVGIGLGGIRLLKRLEYFAPLPGYTRLLLTGILFTTGLDWLGFLGLFHAIPPLLPVIGLGLASYAAYNTHKARVKLKRYALDCFKYPLWPLTLLVLILFATFAKAHWCYFWGGSNNFLYDEIRGASFTTSFAANYLKPAHQLNLSLPVRYGYNFFQYTAFLYSTVNGLSFPTIALWLGSLIAISGFTISFVRFTRLFVHLPSTSSSVIAVLLITFWGLDIFINPELPWSDGHIETWNYPRQITQTGTMWNLLYHYLAASGLGLEALVCLHQAFAKKQKQYLIATALLLVGSLTCATITGIFFGLCAIIILPLYLIFSWKQKTLVWLIRQIPTSLPITLLFLLFILLPQSFVFIGAEGYARFTPHAKLWFNDVWVEKANLHDWYDFFKTLLFELGFVHFVAFLLSPFTAYMLIRKQPMLASIVLGTLISIILCLSFVNAQSFDWYWRSGNNGIMILASLLATVFFANTLPIATRPLRERSAHWLALMLFLLPGINNFYVDEYLRYRDCNPLSERLVNINKTLDLHTGAYKVVTYPRNMYYAGRVPLVDNSDAWIYLHVHGISDRMRKYFPSQKGMPCAHTWYGDSAPNGRFADLSLLDKNRVAVTYHDCPPLESPSKSK